MSQEFKPVLIAFDEMEFERHIHMINLRLIPKLNEIKNEFIHLGLGQLTNEYLNDILFEDLQLIRSQLTDKLRQDNKNLLSRIQHILNEFTDPGNMEISIIIGFPSVDDSGNIVFSDEAISDLRDFHSTYVCTERGIELLKLHSKAAEALNEFYQKVTANISFQEIGEIFSQNKKGEIIPAKIDYDLFHYARQPQTTESKIIHL